MANDAVFRSSLMWLAAISMLVGFYTHSFKKMLATYVLGMFAISGVLLPDWDFFDRSVSQWFTPVTVDEMDCTVAQRATQTRFRIYHVRMGVYSIVYGFGLYKWWMLVSSAA